MSTKVVLALAVVSVLLFSFEAHVDALGKSSFRGEPSWKPNGTAGWNCSAGLQVKYPTLKKGHETRRHEESVERMQHQTVIDEKHGVAYCRIPKNANEMMTSIFMWASGSKEKVWHDSHVTSAAQRQKSGLTYLEDLPSRSPRVRTYTNGTSDDSLFKFVFVRNPFDRLVSAYISKFVGHSRHKKHEKFDYEFDFRIKTRDYPRSEGHGPQFVVASGHREGQLLTFENLIHAIHSKWRNGKLPNSHFAPQTSVCDFHDVKYDYVGVLGATYRDDMDCTFCRTLGWCGRESDEAFFRDQTTRGAIDDPTKFALFSKAALAMAKEVFRGDVEAFGMTWHKSKASQRQSELARSGKLAELSNTTGYRSNKSPLWVPPDLIVRHTVAEEKEKEIA